MTKMQGAVVAAARALVGVRFRPQGRDPAHGLDCVGVAIAALARAGRPVIAPRNYPQHGGSVSRIVAAIDSTGLSRADPGSVDAGDIILMQAGFGQYHLAIKTEGAIVHADASLRRVVERPDPLPWPIVAAWQPEMI